MSDTIFKAVHARPLGTKFGHSPFGTGFPTAAFACVHQCEIGVQMNMYEKMIAIDEHITYPMTA